MSWAELCARAREQRRYGGDEFRQPAELVGGGAEREKEKWSAESCLNGGQRAGRRYLLLTLATMKQLRAMPQGSGTTGAAAAGETGWLSAVGDAQYSLNPDLLPLITPDSVQKHD